MSTSGAERLAVKCPSCGKIGKLPLGVMTYPKVVKCTGCQTKFNPGSVKLEKLTMDAMVLDAIRVKELNGHSFEQQMDFRQKDWSTPPIVVHSDTEPVSSSISEFNQQKNKLGKKFSVSLVVFVLLAVIFTIGATVLTMRLLSSNGPTSQVLTDSQAGQSKASVSASKTEAKEFLVGELDKWVSGQLSLAKTIDYAFNSNPVSYQIKSFYESDPFTTAESKIKLDEFSGEKGDKLVATYRANVDVEFMSRASTPLHKLVKYRVVRLTPSGKWLMAEGDSMILSPR